MKRTTIFVPEALERDLQLYARREQKPTAAIVREALAAYLAQRQPAAELPSFAAAFESGFTDTADRHDDIVFARLSPHAGAPGRTAPRAPRSRKKAKRRA